MRQWKVYELRRGIDDIFIVLHIVYASSASRAILMVSPGLDDDTMELIVLDPNGVEVVERRIF